MIYDEAHYEQLRQVCLSYRNDAERLQQENEQLKQQLAEKDKLLENTIVPKFKVGQEVYINDPYWSGIVKLIINDISYDGKTEYGQNFNGIPQKDIYSTEQEAEEALKKMEE